MKSEAVLRIGRRLNTPFFLLGSLGLPIPSLLRDAAYDLVCMHQLLNAMELTDAQSMSYALLPSAGSKHTIPGVWQDKVMQNV